MDVTFIDETRNRRFSYDGVYEIEYFGVTPTRHCSSVIIYGYDNASNSNYSVRVFGYEFTRILIEEDTQ